MARNENTRNGSVLLDSELDILELLAVHGGSNQNTKGKGKKKGNKKGKGKGKGKAKRSKHIPEHCPLFPSGFTYRHTPIYYKQKGNDEFEDDERQRDGDADDFEKTRKILIAHSAIFSEKVNEESDGDGVPLLGGDVARPT